MFHPRHHRSLYRAEIGQTPIKENSIVYAGPYLMGGGTGGQGPLKLF